jgi:putative flippase GtrA
MTKKDIIFASITGFLVAIVFKGFFANTKFVTMSCNLLWIFTLLSILGLWICVQIGKKYKFIYQAGKFFLVGAFATIVDIGSYKIFAFLLNFLIGTSIISKALSFLVATAVKYSGNKVWVFEKNGKGEIKKEVLQFTFITLIGTIIDVVVFYCLSRQSPWATADATIWLEISIIIAALVASIWNFLGYKFIVFKK